MEKTLHGKSGLVKLEISGKLETLQGDFSHLAADRLNRIRQARDVRNQQKLTWKALDVVVNLTGKVPEYSYFLALLIIVVVLKGLTFPFLKKQYQFQQDQARIGPLIKEIQEKMKGRPQDEVQRRIMQVYKENNVNMAAGCLPMLVLMFVLFPVFWMIRDYEYQFTLGKFLWIGSDFASTTPWLAHNLAQFDVILFVAYLGTTILSSLMQPKPADPEQARQQKMMVITMPLIFGVMMWQYQWSSAFMLYWLVLNLVSMYQSWILLRKMKPGDAPVAVTVTAEAAPATPLTPMKGVRTPNPNAGRGNRVGPPGIPGRVPPRHRRG
jgi:YidC/Oxa1 family membrane protein insertase